MAILKRKRPLRRRLSALCPKISFSGWGSVLLTLLMLGLAGGGVYYYAAEQIAEQTAHARLWKAAERNRRAHQKERREQMARAAAERKARRATAFGTAGTQPPPAPQEVPEAPDEQP